MFTESVDVWVAETGSTDVRAVTAVAVIAAASVSLLVGVVAILLLTAMVMPVSLSTIFVCTLPGTVCADRVAPVPSMI